MAEAITEICNAALRKVGATPLDSYNDDTTENAKHCKNIFPILFDAVLRAQDWNCARARKEYISSEAATPDFGYSYQFTLPTEPWCLRPLRLEDRTQRLLERQGYAIEGRLLLTNYALTNLIYTKRITDMTELDALLTQVMVYLMAIELSPVIKQNQKLPKDIIAFVHEVWRPMALNANGMEGQFEHQTAQTTKRWIDQRDYV